MAETFDGRYHASHSAKRTDQTGFVARVGKRIFSMFKIRPFTAADGGALATLVVEMQNHYGVPCPPLVIIEDRLAHLAEGVEILVAEDETIIGFASFSTIFPGPGFKSGFFLKDLFVSKAARGSGVGKALIHAVAALAVARGYSRVDWTAETKNLPLQAFYESLGANAEREKVFFRLAGEALAACAAAHKSEPVP